MKGNFLKKLRSVLGVLLILLSIGGLFFWELKGRDLIMMDEVLVAKEEIQKGMTVDGTMFTAAEVPRSNLLNQALHPKDLGRIRGKMACQFIAKNSQIVMDYFRGDELALDRNESIFVIDPGWIAMRSSSLRRGDLVDIYGGNGMGLLGTFRIAYVKDEAEREVRNTDVMKPAHSGGILERTDSTSVIDHIEIIATLQEYENLANIAEGTAASSPSALIIVQKGIESTDKEALNQTDAKASMNRLEESMNRRGESS